MPPFSRNVELNGDFRLVPLDQPCEIENDDIGSQPGFLPGYPLIPLASPELCNHMRQLLLTPLLDRLAPKLWLLATPSSKHITSLHCQIVKGRSITITENPELHCCWIYDRVFLKPIPPFLLSWAFWQRYLCDKNPIWPQKSTATTESPVVGCQGADLKRSALGFLRTYSILIQHESDFRLLQAHHLIPSSAITYPQFMHFIACFSHYHISDEEVSPRYTYGELRLGRLNFWSKLLLRQWTFQKVHIHYGYGAYFSRVYGPLLFVFGVLTVILSSMQVVASLGDDEGDSRRWKVFASISRWFSIFTIICVVVLMAALASIGLIMVLREVVFAVSKIIERKWGKKRREEKET